MTKFIAEHPSVLAEKLDSEVVQFRQYFGGRSKFDKIVWTGTQKMLQTTIESYCELQNPRQVGT